MRQKIPAAFYFGALPGTLASNKCTMRHKTLCGRGIWYLDTLYVTEFIQETYKKCLHNYENPRGR
jgi:hypothetical protein